ncbi:hypothetical protein BG004_000311 [Podila humilis]|nr:hypothetical protein BG004_000311 [Podila humilis]
MPYVSSPGADPPAFTVTVASMLHYLRTSRASFLQLVMGVHMCAVAAPKRIIQLLSAMGLSVCYSSTTTCLQALARENIELVREIALVKPIIILYDNFNRRVTHRHQRHDNPDFFENGVTATIVVGMDIGPDRESPVGQPKIEDILLLQEDTDRFRSIFFSHFIRSIDDCQHKNPFLAGPKVAKEKPLPLTRSETYELATILIDQATVAGNVAILEEFRRVLGIPKNKFQFIRWIVAGDQLTVARVFSAQEQNVGEATYFDMLLCSTILKTHYGSMSTPGSLAFFIPVLRRRQVSREMPCYYAADEFLRTVFQAMVSRVWRTKESAYVQANGSPSMNSSTFDQEIRSIVNELLTASTLLFDKCSITNANAVMFIRDMIVYIEFCEAIKQGDVGRIEEILKRITVMFQAGEHKNYALELLSFRYNIDYVWSPERKEAVFSSLLMNTKGQENKWIPSDLYQEHNNLFTKEAGKSNGNRASTMSYMSSSVRLLHEIGNKIERAFNVPQNSTFHTSTSMESDVKKVLRSLEEHSVLCELPSLELHQEPRFSTTRTRDLMVEGVEKLLDDGFSKFVRRVEESKLGEELAKLRNLETLMEDLRGETGQADEYIQRVFNE